MEVIVSHEYEMFGSLSFNTVRAVDAPGGEQSPQGMSHFHMGELRKA